MSIARAASPKFAAPDVGQAVDMPRIDALVDCAAAAAMVWISGPGGAGKTVAAAQYARRSARPLVWLTIDDGDAYPAVFFTVLGGAVRQAFRRRRVRIAEFTPEYAGALGTFARNWFHDLFAQLPHDALLVLDNAQLAHDLQRLLAAAGEMAPAGVTVIVTGRDVPGKPLARLLARQRLRAIGWPALRRTDEEMRALGARHGIELPAELLGTLDGWAAGVTLTAAAGHIDLGDLDAAATTEQQFDYFAAEVFDALAPRERRFLVANALWPRIEPALAAELTGERGAARLLAGLARRNLFITRHGKRAPGYSLHPLFRAFLRERAPGVFDADALDALRRRAAELLDARGELEAAMALRVEAADWPTVAAITARYGIELLARGRHLRMLRWLEDIPQRVVEDHPVFSLWRGLCHVVTRPAQGLRELTAALEAFTQRNDRLSQFTTLAALLESRLLLFDLDGSRALVERLLALRERHDALRSPALDALALLGVLGTLAVIEPRHPRLETFEALARRYVAGPAPQHRRLICAAILTYLYTARAQHRQQRAIAAIVRADPPDAQRLPYASISWRTTEAVHRYWFDDDIEDLPVEMDTCRALAADKGITATAEFILDATSYVTFGTAHGPSARRLAGHLHGADPPAAAYHRALHHLRLGWFEWSNGNLGGATGELHAGLGAVVPATAPLVVCYLQLALARVHRDDGNRRAALGALASARHLGRHHALRHVNAMCRLLGAELALDAGRARRARVLLADGLRRAASVGLRRTVLHSPGALARLARFALANGLETGYVRRLIEVLALPPPAPVLRPDEWRFPVEIRCLGEFSLHRDGQPVRFGHKEPRRPLQLLKLLVGHGARRVPVATLTDALWPDADRPAAERSLRSALHRLRTILGAGCLDTADDALSLNPVHCWADVAALRAAFDDRPANVDDEAILALYRGQFLAGDTLPIYDAPRERLRERFVQHLSHTLERHGARRDWSAVLAFAGRAIETEPDIERFHQHTIEALVELGRYGDALAVYRRCREMLARVYAVRPSPDTRALVHRARALAAE